MVFTLALLWYMYGRAVCLCVSYITLGNAGSWKDCVELSRNFKGICPCALECKLDVVKMLFLKTLFLKLLQRYHARCGKTVI